MFVSLWVCGCVCGGVTLFCFDCQLFSPITPAVSCFFCISLRKGFYFRHIIPIFVLLAIWQLKSSLTINFWGALLWTTAQNRFLSPRFICLIFVRNQSELFALQFPFLLFSSFCPWKDATWTTVRTASGSASTPRTGAGTLPASVIKAYRLPVSISTSTTSIYLSVCFCLCFHG